MTYIPTPHQIEGRDRLLDYHHGYIWDAPGTGKTLTAMEAFRVGPHQKLIVLCPKIALTMWKHELEKHLMVSKVSSRPFYARVLNTGRIPNKVRVNGKMVGAKFMDADAIVTTYDLFKKHVAAMRAFILNGNSVNERWKTAMILDEAHLIKTPTNQRTMAVSTFDVSGKLVDDYWQLTGTPVMRYYDDLYSQLKLGRQEVLAGYNVRTYDQFRKSFCVVDYKQFGSGRKQLVITGNKNSKRLKSLLDDCLVLRRTLDDVMADLPPLLETTLTIPLAHKAAIPSLPLDYATLIRELNDPNSAAAKVRRLVGLAKVKDVADYIMETERLPVLLGFWHQEVGHQYVEVLSAKFGRERVAMVSGATPSAARESIREQFNAGQLDVLVGQMQAMNASWNIQEACHHVIIAEELMSPSELTQFYSRVRRKGQKRPVYLTHMRSAHSLDDALVFIRAKKAAGVEDLGL